MTHKRDDDDIWDNKTRELYISTEVRQLPCSTCPFLVDNFERRDGGRSDAFYTHERLSEVWGDPDDGLRHGTVFCCHSSGTPAQGGTNPNATHPRMCPGALAVQQREAIRFCEGNPDEKVGLTPKGFRRVVYLMLRAPVFDTWRIRKHHILERAHPRIADPSIGHPDLAPPEPGEFE